MSIKGKSSLGIVAATLIVGLQIGSTTPAQAGTASVEQLQTIAKMSRNNKVDDLMGFLDKNPQLTAGPGALSRELRETKTSVHAGNSFSFNERAREALERAGAPALERAGGPHSDGIY